MNTNRSSTHLCSSVFQRSALKNEIHIMGFTEKTVKN